MSSLFAHLNQNNNNAVNQKPSLFTNLNDSSTSSGPSLFPSTNQPPSAQPSSNPSGATSNNTGGGLGGLFGRINKPDASTSGPGLSIGATSTGAAGGGGGSLFDRITATNPAASTSSSGGALFGAAASSQQQSQPPTSTGPFNSTKPPGQAPSQPQSTSVFGASILNNNAGGSAQAARDGKQPESAPRAAFFEDLLQRGRKRRDPGADSSQLGQLPSLQLGLGDISNKIKGLGSNKTAQRTNRTGDSTAHYLLAASGVPRGATRRDLDAFAASQGVPARPSPAAFDPDLDKYVERLESKTTKELMEESFRQSKRDFDTFLEDSIQIDWQQQRQRIYEHFGLTKPGEELAASYGGRGSPGKSSRRSTGPSASVRGRFSGSFAASAASRSVLGGSIPRGSIKQNLFTDVSDITASSVGQSALDDPFQRNKQEKYAAMVTELNTRRIEDEVFPVIQNFSQVEKEGGSDTPKHLIDAYRALKEIVRENTNIQRPSEPGAVRERQYADNYLDDDTNSGRSIEMRKQILDGSLKFLQDSFYQHVEETVAKNPQEGNPGGRPSRIDHVRAYIRIKAARKSLGADVADLQTINDKDYCWALLYYLLRSGLVREAVQYVSDNLQPLKTLDRHFQQYIRAFSEDADRRLPPNLQDRINNEYGQRARLAENASIDPYRMACYKILGRCELSKKTIEGINASVDDLIWLYFCLARESNRLEVAAAETFGLEEIQEIIKDIGNRHFPANADSGPGHATFFLMQMLCGQFEEAIAWLYRYNYVSAVHFAIALDFYGLLRVSDFAVSDSALLSYSTRQYPQISFARLVGYYTRDFRLTRAQDAVNYLALISLNADLPGEAGRAQASVCHEALKELVLETREFAMLLGDVRANGRRLSGLITNLMPLLQIAENQGNFLRSLTIQAAASADDAGRITDAVLLFHLAEDYDKVVAIVNTALTDALAAPLEEEPIRLQPLKPRTVEQQNADQNSVLNCKQEQRQQGDTQTTSLTSVDDPVTLARRVHQLYDSQPPISLSEAFTRNGQNTIHAIRVNPVRRVDLDFLLKIANVRDSLVARQPPQASLELMALVDLLPLRADGSMSAIRACAQQANNASEQIAHVLGPLLQWCIGCIKMTRDEIKMSGWEEVREGQLRHLAATAKDVMVFAGLVRYRVGAGVMEGVVRSGQDFEAGL